MISTLVEIANWWYTLNRGKMHDLNAKKIFSSYISIILIIIWLHFHDRYRCYTYNIFINHDHHYFFWLVYNWVQNWHYYTYHITFSIMTTNNSIWFSSVIKYDSVCIITNSYKWFLDLGDALWCSRRNRFVTNNMIFCQMSLKTMTNL